jgi:uncharacterized protein YceK
MYPRAWLTIALIIAVALSGCASSQTATPQQALAQMGAQQHKESLNQQIVNLGAQAAVQAPRDY